MALEVMIAPYVYPAEITRRLAVGDGWGGLEMKLILAATDFSARSDRAIRRAGLLAREQDARLMLLHVVDDDRPERLVVAELVTAQELLEKTAAAVPSGCRCESKVVLGDPFDGIERVARESAADLIVMGIYGHSRLREFVLGGASRTLLASMTVPVLMSH
jgi:nucleotide-binding universal stress UspA family protein